MEERTGTGKARADQEAKSKLTPQGPQGAYPCRKGRRKMDKKYYLEAAHRYNHGCQDSAVYRDNGDGTATCIEAHTCRSCWQVGHDRDHVYAEVGDVVPVRDLLADPDMVD